MVNVRITRPELTHEERVKRMNAFKEAAVQLVLATERAHLQKQKRGNT